MLWNATLYVRCLNRASAYGAAWLAPANLIRDLPEWRDRNALEYASFHLYERADALKAADDSWWVDHISGYEHNARQRKGVRSEDDVDTRVASVVHALRRAQCGPLGAESAAPMGPGAATLALVPFYGGAPRSAGNGTDAFTGSSHSRAGRGLKLHTLHANLCSMLHVAKHALVAVCDDRDLHDVTTHVLQHLPAGRAEVRLVDCARAPGYLPFRLLRRLQLSLQRRRTGGVAHGGDGLDRFLDARDIDYVMYNEADQVMQWTYRAAVASIFDVIRDNKRAYVAPQRYERNGGGRGMRKAMNKCSAKGVRLYTTASGKVSDDHVAPTLPVGPPDS